MAQHDYVIDNSTGANVRADINSVLQAIASNNSGSSDPSTTYAFQLFADTTNNVMKIRNAANNGFIELFQLDGTFTLEDGSASTPALAFRDDLNTGIFSSAADTFNVATAGTERYRIDSSGRLLFGTESSRSVGDCTSQIQLEGTGFASSSLSLISNAGASAGNIPHLTLGKSRGSSDGSNTIVANGDKLGVIQFAGADGTDCNSLAASILANVDGAPGSNDMPGNLTFNTTADGAATPTERMRIDSSGNVGIGTTSPANSLDIGSGNIKLSGGNGAALTWSNDVSSHYLKFTTALNGLTLNGFGGLAFETNGSNERMRIDSSGRLLIGKTSTSQTHTLQVQSDSNANAIAVYGRSADDIGELGFYENDGTTRMGEIQYRTTEASFRHRSAGASLLFSTTPSGGSVTERVRIDSSGNLMIGTTDTNLMTNSGDGDKGMVISKASGIQVKATNHHTAEFNRAGTTGGSVLFFHDGTEVGNIAVTSSATSYNTSSDYRLKENVVAISDGITRLKGLKPSRFNFKADASITVDGFLAHEVTAVPEAITGTKDAVVTQALIDAGEYKEGTLNDPIYQAIDQSKLVPLLVAAVQELIGKVEALEAA